MSATNRTREIRIVIEPRSRTVDAQLLMESLFRMSDLENRVSLNLNVLDAKRTPRVMSLREALHGWVDHQFVVLRRRTAHRLGKIGDRVELLDGYLIAYLNLDRVIEIIRTEDEPKPIMIAEFGLTDRQAEAILNMRLRSLRRLEEMEIRKEREGLEAERTGLEALLGSDARQRTRLKKDLGKLRDRYGPETALGKRRTTIEEAAPAREIPLEAMIEREPITVIVSQRGWIRAMKGHADAAGIEALKFKEGDGPLFAFPAQTTDKILLAAENGRFYTLAADKLPGRPGLWRAGAADDRPRRRCRDRRADAGEQHGEAARRRHRRARLHRAHRRYDRGDAQGQDGRHAAPRGEAQAGPPGRAQCRLCRGDRRQSPHARLPAQRTRRAGARAGGAAPALSRWRPVRRDDLRVRRRAELDDGWR